MLNVQSLTVRYGALTIVDQVSFSVEPRHWLMIVGPNGAGKSTVLNAVTQGVPYTGRVSFAGEDVRKQKPRALARYMGVLTQNHFVGYGFTVEEIVRLGRYAYAPGPFADNRGDDGAIVAEALRLTGMTELASQSVLTLSGGELQRAFLAQVFAQDPQLLLLDEPTNHLDLIYQKQVFGLITDWLKTPGRAVVSVVHDLSLARRYGTDALLLHHGRVAASGTVGETLTPQNLDAVYGMDVAGWMRGLLSGWEAQ